MIALVWGGSAWAWNQVQGSTCGDASWASATTAVTYRINSNDFSAAERTEIELAGDAWRAGSGQLVRGATWGLTRGADTTSDGSSSSVDGINVVARKPSTFFSSAGAYATTRLWVDSSCEIVEADVYVNSAPVVGGTAVTFTTDLPSQIAWGSNTEASLGQIVVHEFGHATGLEHSDVDGTQKMLAVMNTNYPAGGDISARRYRISEDDYVGLAALHSGSSTGRNLMVTKFSNELVSQGNAREAWTVGEEDADGNLWCNVAGGFMTSAITPTMPTLLITGTGGSVTANVKWRLNTPGTNCNGGDEYTIESRDYTLGVNTPYRPPAFDWTFPANVPVGSYELCVIVDAANSVTETEETLDNNLFSDRLFRIESNLATCL